jgi:hypothetical protein
MPGVERGPMMATSAAAGVGDGLLDELRLWVHPFFVGSGGPADLLYRNCPVTKLNLLDTRALKNGIVILTYEFAETGRG